MRLEVSDLKPDLRKCAYQKKCTLVVKEHVVVTDWLGYFLFLFSYF